MVCTLIYYFIFSLMVKIFTKSFNDLYALPLSFLFGITGWIERVPLFISIPIVFMLTLLYFKAFNSWFVSFSVCIIISYLSNFFWLVANDNHLISNYNSILFILPGLSISVLNNWILFKETYKRIGV